MAPTIERIAESSELGEGPHWDVETQNLYYVDIFGKTINRYTPATKEYRKAVVGSDPVSFIIPVEGAPNKYVIGYGRKLVVVTWDGEGEKVSLIETITEVEASLEGNRFNDGKSDPSGRLWAGTLGKEEVIGHIDPNKGTLYSLGSNREAVPHLSPVSISNGLAWSLENEKFYYIDSPERVIYQFDYDKTKGTISNRQVIFSLVEQNIEGFPDGQTIDADGNLWVAVFNGYRVIKIDPRKPNTLLQTVNFPAKQVTSVAFGGPNLDELYVTSARMIIDGVVLSPPDHGALFRVTGLGVKGVPAVKVKL